MDIKVLGPGCAKCRALEKQVRGVVTELGMDATVEEVKDMVKIMEYKVMMTPGLVIDGRVVSSGQVPSRGDVRKIIEEAGKRAS
ncbi:MAG: TM0996/MTH895 family glutaredoxin-like protein [Chloroflexi bacterium]|nr:TM0996/MTH895 family glutaredoxin-like protein [Chloroflexota bacterium]